MTEPLTVWGLTDFLEEVEHLPRIFVPCPQLNNSYLEVPMDAFLTAAAGCLEGLGCGDPALPAFTYVTDENGDVWLETPPRAH